MAFYEDRILPHLVHLSMRQDTFLAYRRRVVPAAQGRVLEIGVGSGLNLPLYTDAAEHVVGVDTSPRLLSMARHVHRSGAASTELIEGSAEALPLGDKSIDTVVTTASTLPTRVIRRAANGPDGSRARDGRGAGIAPCVTFTVVSAKRRHNSWSVVLDARAAAVKYSRACGKPRSAFVDSCYVRHD
ncbi:MAG TPA: class I SAM-dependent methyltransferase [Vicinamibacterales bacterium]|nr:class I SAM-dependent methyltransferase [Vicinamibacterales bacterium]